MRASLAASTITRSLIAPLAGPKTTATVLSSAIASACRLSDLPAGALVSDLAFYFAASEFATITQNLNHPRDVAGGIVIGGRGCGGGVRQ